MALSHVEIVHIAAGSVALATGAAALWFKKGSPPHRAAGNLFFVSMLIMSAVGAMMAAGAPDRTTTLAGVFTFYLVATGWVTVKRPEGTIGAFERAAVFVAIGAAAAGLSFGYIGSTSPKGLIDGLPYQAGYAFGALAAIAALCDVTVIGRRGLCCAQRIARHLWRMCLALGIASMSFFIGQQDEFPEAVQGSPVLIALALAPIVFLFFWLAVALITRRFRDQALSNASDA